MAKFCPIIGLLFLSLLGCLETHPLGEPLFSNADVEYEIDATQCFPLERIFVDYPVDEKFDSLRICVSADSVEKCVRESYYIPTYPDRVIKLEFDFFRPMYTLSYEVFYNNHIIETDILSIKGKTRSEANRLPGRIAFHFNQEVIEFVLNLEDSSYVSDVSFAGRQVRGELYFSVFSLLMDSIVIKEIPLKKDFRVTLSDTALTYFVQGDRIKLPILQHHPLLNYHYYVFTNLADTLDATEFIRTRSCLDISFSQLTNKWPVQYPMDDGYVVSPLFGIQVNWSPDEILFLDTNFVQKRFLCGNIDNKCISSD